VLGNAEHAIVTVGEEEFEAELHAAGNAPDIARNCDGAMNIAGVDRNEYGFH
jgi:hypothetical protein